MRWTKPVYSKNYGEPLLFLNNFPGSLNGGGGLCDGASLTQEESSPPIVADRLLARWASQPQADVDVGNASQSVFETTLGEAADMLVQKQPDDGGEIEGCFLGGIEVRESISGNVEVGDDTCDVIVNGTGFLCLRSEVIDEVYYVIVRSV